MRIVGSPVEERSISTRTLRDTRRRGREWEANTVILVSIELRCVFMKHEDICGVVE